MSNKRGRKDATKTEETPQEPVTETPEVEEQAPVTEEQTPATEEPATAAEPAAEAPAPEPEAPTPAPEPAAAPAPAEAVTPTYRVAVRNFYYQQRFWPVGASVSLPAEKAERLLTAGAIVRA